MGIVLLSKQENIRVTGFILSRLFPCRKVLNFRNPQLFFLFGLADGLAKRGAIIIKSERKLMCIYLILVEATCLRFY